MRIRVASYNLRGLKDDPAAAAEVVRRIDPDVLLLQEVPRHPLSGWRIAAFARRCGLRWSGRTRRLSGTGMMTSHRVDASASIDRKLPVARWANPRSYTVARVRVPHDRDVTAAAQVARPSVRGLTVVSIHLSLLDDERFAHTTRILDELSARPTLGDGPFVVGGDLNEDSTGRAWCLLGERLRLASPERLTFPAATPRRPIDAIFASSQLTVLPHEDVELEPELLAAATDHLPVWIDLEVS